MATNRPTIRELEELFLKEEEIPLEILPNGEVRARGATPPEELGGRKPLTMRENLGGEYGLLRRGVALSPPIDRRAMHSELLANHRARLRGQRCLGHALLLRAELVGASANPALGAGNSEAGSGSLHDALTLELREDTHDDQKHLAGRGLGVDLLLEGPESDLPCAKILDQDQEVVKVTSHPVEAPRHQDIARAQVCQRFGELGARGLDAARDLLINAFASRFTQGGYLLDQPLLRSGNPRIADQHGESVAILVESVQFRDTEFRDKFRDRKTGVPRHPDLIRTGVAKLVVFATARIGLGRARGVVAAGSTDPIR